MAVPAKLFFLVRKCVVIETWLIILRHPPPTPPSFSLFPTLLRSYIIRPDPLAHMPEDAQVTTQERGTKNQQEFGTNTRGETHLWSFFFFAVTLMILYPSGTSGYLKRWSYRRYRGCMKSASSQTPSLSLHPLTVQSHTPLVSIQMKPEKGRWRRPLNQRSDSLWSVCLFVCLYVFCFLVILNHQL